MGWRKPVEQELWRMQEKIELKGMGIGCVIKVFGCGELL
jgi:hypothetical protein